MQSVASGASDAQTRQTAPTRYPARKLPPVFRVTSATIPACDRVQFLVESGLFSRWIVTAIAIDFLPSSMPLPS